MLEATNQQIKIEAPSGSSNLGSQGAEGNQIELYLSD